MYSGERSLPLKALVYNSIKLCIFNLVVHDLTSDISYEAKLKRSKSVIFAYMSKTDHEYDIVDIVTIETRFRRHRYQHTVTISSKTNHV